MSTWVVPALAGGLLAGTCVWFLLHRVFRRRTQEFQSALDRRDRELEERLRADGDAVRLRAQVAARDELQAERSSLESEISQRRQELRDIEERLATREEAVHRQLDRAGELDADLRRRSTELDAGRKLVDELHTRADQLVATRRLELERSGGLTAAEARNQILRDVERDTAAEAADITRKQIADARARAEHAAREIIATAIQRIAGKHTFETTTATVALSGDDMKGRIIGRDGRNIRAFENATGVTVLVDDTPNAVVLSGFDPVRREVARQAMERLILDGRIHPARIEEVVISVNQEMDSFIMRTGEEAVARTAVPPVHPDVARLLGKLHFRTSFSQNVLDHSVEVAHLCGLMAAELGEDIPTAKRAGLLHDIGKAVSHEQEGPHAIVGAQILRQSGESPAIVNAVASHHHEVPHENIFGVLVSASDAISASRPGARSETMTTYLKRLENLEQIALEFDGVERAFAVQAGRELRVVVRPEAVNDDASLNLARQMARRVEQELHYPGQIRITVIREMRCIEYAK